MAPKKAGHVLFSLRGYNSKGTAVVTDSNNRHFLSESNGDPVLEIRYDHQSKSPDTLLTIGRLGDVRVDNRLISRIQCSFEIDQKTGIIMLYDRSTSGSTQVHSEGSNCMKMKTDNHVRRVLVNGNINTVIGMGGTYSDNVMFELLWNYNTLQAMSIMQHRSTIPLHRQNPCHALTVAAETEAPSRITRMHTPSYVAKSETRYSIVGEIAAGTSGNVKKVVDVDLGDVYAMKIISPPQDADKATWAKEKLPLLKREVENLFRLRHVSESLL